MDPAGLWQRLAGQFPPNQVPFLAPAPQSGPRRWALVLAYCGRDYAGWQVQSRADTIQGRVEQALGQLCAESVRLAASGRTDAGVHAWGQVASFESQSPLAPAEMSRGLKALLPKDITLRQLGPVPEEFHARYSALDKTYYYYLWPNAPRSPFLDSLLWPLPGPLDQRAVEAALALLPGEHDLAGLASGGSEVKGSTRRRILQADLAVGPQGLWRLRLKASGFLRHAVRNLVGVLWQMGSGRLKPGQLGEMLAAGRRLYPGPKAPPGGLYLAQVSYDADNLHPLREEPQ